MQHRRKLPKNTSRAQIAVHLFIHAVSNVAGVVSGSGSEPLGNSYREGPSAASNGRIANKHNCLLTLL